MNEDPGALLPELFLLGSAVAGLLAGSFLPRRRQWLVSLLAAVAAACGLVATGVAFASADRVVFGTSYAVDTPTNATRLVVLAALLLALALARPEAAGGKRETEFVVLLQLGALGAILLAGANDLLLVFAAYLLASVPLYALTAFAKDAAGTEAALKYYLLGALSGVVSLLGVAVLYGAARTTAYLELRDALAAAPAAAVGFGLVAFLAALLFKLGAVPAQFWVPDVAQGAPAAVAAFVTTVPKAGAVVAVYRLAAVALPGAGVDWRLLLAAIAAASMTLGNLAAFLQTSARRLLGYSTISQVGYLLIAAVVAARSELALRGLLFYVAAYAVTNLAAFAVCCALPYARDLHDFRGLARRHPGLAAVLAVALLGLVGTPPTGVFVGKLEVFTAGVDSGYAWLVTLAVANTVASLFYYLRWLAPAFLQSPDAAAADQLAPAGSRLAVGAAYGAGAVALLLGPLAGLVLPLFGGGILR